MTRQLAIAISCIMSVGTICTCAELPTVEQVTAKALDNLGGADGFKRLGVLQITIKEQENLLDGKTINRKNVSFVDTGNLVNLRSEMPGDVVIVRNGNRGWAQIKGELDERPQSPRMAVGTLNQRLLPLLLPFTLTSSEVTLLTAIESEYEGTASWRMAFKFPEDYFTSPSMNTTWFMEVARDSGKVLMWEFQPSIEFSKARSEGVRYTVLRTTALDGIRLPVEILIDGIDREGRPTGHTQAVTLNFKKYGPFDPVLFVHPEQLAALEEGS